MITKYKKILSALIPVSALALPLQVFAQDPENLVPPETIGQITSIVKVVRAAIQFILVVAFVLAFIFLLIGGIRWITAGGDEKAVAGARGMITAALIGLVIVLVSYAIIRLVEIFFGFNIITGGVTVPCYNPPCTQSQ